MLGLAVSLTVIAKSVDGELLGLSLFNSGSRFASLTEQETFNMKHILSSSVRSQWKTVVL